jgi:hypothetical protein
VRETGVSEYLATEGDKGDSTMVGVVGSLPWPADVGVVLLDLTEFHEGRGYIVLAPHPVRPVGQQQPEAHS